LQEQAKFSSFKAAPVKISGSPFRPERSKMPLTEVIHHSCRCCRCCLCHPVPRRVCDSSLQVTPFELNTDKRKEDRFVAMLRHSLATLTLHREEFEMKKSERMRTIDCAKVGLFAVVATLGWRLCCCCFCVALWFSVCFWTGADAKCRKKPRGGGGMRRRGRGE
jgi:hypothetical protein